MTEFAVDNFLSDEQEDAILSLTTDPNFPWFYSAGTVIPDDIKDNPFIITKGDNPFQFIHQVDLKNCPYVGIISPVLDFLAQEFQKNMSIVKIKFNMLTRGVSNEFHFPHTDVDEADDCYTAIYYVNDVDGPTYLFNEFGPKDIDDLTIRSTIQPQKGKLAVFKANRFHASSSPIDSDIRIILNIVFKV